MSTQSYFPGSAASPAKKQRMSLTQTYYIASTARSKLGREASRADHNLRLLVGHANLLDTLMIELQDAEREQEAWFNESIKASKPEPATRHIQWIDSIAEELEDDSSDEESDDEYAFYDEDDDLVRATPLSYSVSTVSTVEVDDDEFEEDYEYDDEHALTRVDSHPPELVHGDSDSEDESMPPSPTQEAMDLQESQHDQPIKTTPYLNKMDHSDYLGDNVVISQRQSTMISAY
ncbi:hypothetical protein E4T39_07321 [Aureobasidium subglaciale]|nr:hypothetical protein E4T39_07321 [Aureobasidium subglaciale]